MSSSSDPIVNQDSSIPLADFKAGFLVFLIALPLSLGIAMASGVPPVAGLITAVVGGVLVSWLGSAPLTIKGPAAGLIVIVLGAVEELGQGDPMLGYRRALAVGVMAAVLQLILALSRSASIGMAMSPSVVHGMLAAIGVIIVSKQLHAVLGVKPEGGEPFELIAELPRSILHANPEILAIGGISLCILFGHSYLKHRFIQAVAGPLWVLLVAVPLGLLFDIDHAHNYTLWAHSFHLGPEFLVSLPTSVTGAFTFPDFSMAFSSTSLKYVMMFALVGSIESVLSVLAVDAMDPQKRASNLNRDLFAVGAGNLFGSMIGGLPMISEIVRSKANLDAGARSSKANFSHGLLLAAAVVLIPQVLHHIPLAALAAMLVFTGARLASPREMAHASRIGGDQLVLFVTTLLVTLATDLLVGVTAGIATKFVLHQARGASLMKLFQTSVESSTEGELLTVTLHGAAAFTSLLKVRRILTQLPESIRRVDLNLQDVVIVDHTFLSRIQEISDEWKNANLCIVGIESFESASDHPTATRRRRR